MKAKQLLTGGIAGNKTIGILLLMCIAVSAAFAAPGSWGVREIAHAGPVGYVPYVSVVATPTDNPLINPAYDRSYDSYTVTSPTGLVHPGVLHSREDLNTMRDMAWLGKEPWASAF